MKMKNLIPYLLAVILGVSPALTGCHKDVEEQIVMTYPAQIYKVKVPAGWTETVLADEPMKPIKLTKKLDGKNLRIEFKTYPADAYTKSTTSDELLNRTARPLLATLTEAQGFQQKNATGVTYKGHPAVFYEYVFKKDVRRTNKIVKQVFYSRSFLFDDGQGVYAFDGTVYADPDNAGIKSEFDRAWQECTNGTTK